MRIWAFSIPEKYNPLHDENLIIQKSLYYYDLIHQNLNLQFCEVPLGKILYKRYPNNTTSPVIKMLLYIKQ
jgi:ABC-type phosphate transport system auxiliary subunit